MDALSLIQVAAVASGRLLGDGGARNTDNSVSEKP